MSFTSRRIGAVLVIVCCKGAEPHIVLTRRSQEVALHKGEISFPGGAREAQDETLLATALREGQEELGVDLRGAQILTKLDDAPTAVSNFIVSPYVAFLEAVPQFRPEPSEVSEVIVVPLTALLDPAAIGEEEWPAGGPGYRLQYFLYGSHRIWGATARILRQFLELYSRGELHLPACVGARGTRAD